MDAARAQTDERESVEALVPLEHLVRDAHQRPLDRLRLHHLTRLVAGHAASPAHAHLDDGRRAKKTPPRQSREATDADLIRTVFICNPF